MGVTAIRLLMMGTPNSASICRPVSTSLPAYRRIFSLIRRRLSLPLSQAQSRREIPMVMARTSSLYLMNMLMVS